jgi:predicted GIY-YIG superfamily endonuclease
MSRYCYLLHFTAPYKHARHYLGTTKDLFTRIQLHKAGKGARLTQVVRENGIDFYLVRTWDGGRQTERRLKRQKNSPRLCPVCNPPRETESEIIPF